LRGTTLRNQGFFWTMKMQYAGSGGDWKIPERDPREPGE